MKWRPVPAGYLANIAFALPEISVMFAPAGIVSAEGISILPVIVMVSTVPSVGAFSIADVNAAKSATVAAISGIPLGEEVSV